MTILILTSLKSSWYTVSLCERQLNYKRPDQHSTAMTLCNIDICFLWKTTRGKVCGLLFNFFCKNSTEVIYHFVHFTKFFFSDEIKIKMPSVIYNYIKRQGPWFQIVILMECKQFCENMCIWYVAWLKVINMLKCSKQMSLFISWFVFINLKRIT